MHFLFLFLLFCVSLVGQSKPTMPIAEIEQQPIEWTQFIPSPDTRIVYIDNVTGNNNNSGLSPTQAKATIQAGYNLLRDGFPDWLLLKRGCTFNEQIEWNKSGRSGTERILMGAYGDESIDRPIIIPPTTAAVFTFRNYVGFNNAIFTSLDIKNPSYVPAPGASLVGLSFLGRFNNLLIEDVRTTGMSGGIVLFNPANIPGDNVVIRRCQILNGFSAPNISHSNGMFASNQRNFVVEDCLFDHNGWKEGDPSTQTIFNHNIYFHDSGSVYPLILRNSILSRASSHGVQMRSGGIADNNLFYQNPLNILVGSGAAVYPPVPTTISNNVIDDSRNIFNDARGNGFDIGGGDNHLIINNIIKNRVTGNPLLSAISFNGNRFPVRNPVLTKNIIWQWNAPSFYFSGNLSNFSLRNNYIYEPTSVLITDGTSYPLMNHRTSIYWSTNPTPFRWSTGFLTPTQFFAAVNDTGSVFTQSVFPNPSRTLSSYYNTIFNTNTGAMGFINAARENRRGRWDPRLTAPAVNDWIRAGFGR